VRYSRRKRFGSPTWCRHSVTAALVASLMVAACGAPSSPSLSEEPAAASRRPSASVGVATARPSRPTPAVPAGVDEVIRLSGAPHGVGVGHGSVWVTSHRGSLLYRIDPDATAIEAQIVIGREQCGEVTVGDDLVWVNSCGNFNIAFRVDPLTNRVVGSDQWPGLSVAYGADSLWAVLDYSTPGTVGRFDPATYEVAARIPVGAGPTYLGYGFGSAWVGNVRDGSVQRIDPEKNAVVATVLVGPPGDGSAMLTVGEDAVWVGNVSDGSVYRIDPGTNTVERLDLGLTKLTEAWDLFIETSPGAIWLRTSDDTIARIDTQTREVVATYPASGGGGDMEVAFGSLWVSNFADDTLWRIGIDDLE
jgi:virginiamycin B lyase